MIPDGGAQLIESSGQRRGPYAKTKARRKEILHTAIDVFAEAGYRGASLREIAQRVGLSESGVVHHFGDKETLLECVLEERDAEDLEHFPGIGAGGIEEVRALASLVEFNASRPRIVELFTILSAEATASDHPAHSFFVERSKRIRAGTERAFVTVAEEGLLRPGVDPRLTATTLIALMDGLQVQWLLDPDSVDMGASVAAFMCSVLVVPLWDEDDQAPLSEKTAASART